MNLMKNLVHALILFNLFLISVPAIWIGFRLGSSQLKMGLSKLLAPILIGYSLFMVFLVGLCWFVNINYIGIYLPAAFLVQWPIIF
jgi:hypothetical protein